MSTPDEKALDEAAKTHANKIAMPMLRSMPDISRGILFTLLNNAYLVGAAFQASRSAERIEKLEAVVRMARNASNEIQAQKVCWPGEVDTLKEAIAALDEHGEGKRR